MTRKEPWNKAAIQVLTQGDGSRVQAEEEKLEQILENVRIDAAVQIVENFQAEAVVRHSADATFVYLPLRIEQNRILDPAGQSFERSLPRLPVCAAVMAAEDIDLDAAPEEGLAAAIAQATDALEAAQQKAREAEKAAIAKQTALEKLTHQLETLEEHGIAGAVPLDEWKALKADFKEAELAAEKAYRRAIKARIKAGDAAKAIDALSPGSALETHTPDTHERS